MLHEVMSGRVVLVRPCWREGLAEPEHLHEFTGDGRSYVLRPSEYLPRYGDPERDRAAAAIAVRIRRMVETGDPWEAPARVVEVEATEVPIERLPGHGTRWAKRAAEIGFEVRAVWSRAIAGQGIEPTDHYSLRMRMRNAAIAGLWINGQAAGGAIAVLRDGVIDRTAIKISEIPALLETIATAV